MARGFWILFGAATHGLFAATVYYLYLFLRGDPSAAEQVVTKDVREAWLVDSLLAVQFAVGHSWLLHPSTRKKLSKWIPGPAYGVFFCGATCLSLLLTIAFWRPIAGGPWNWTAEGFVVMRFAFFLSWVALFYSLYVSGIGYQTGWTTWWPWIRRRPVPRRDFQPRSVFLLLRHPVYLSFLGLIWFTPTMTWDRAALVFWWTIYIFAGSYLKDRRLEHYIGAPYREYQAEVPGYPGFVFGPLARVPTSAAVPEVR
jgi:protein-S-isoprenylcysteine O-methyltransferase Ste14